MIFDSRMFAAINDMLLDMLAAVARRDYEQRRERQRQGISKAQKREGIRGDRPIRSDTMPSIGCSIAVVHGVRYRKLWPVVEGQLVVL
nr:hypothetical protein MJEJOPCA_00002 [Escherichia sp.]